MMSKDLGGFVRRLDLSRLVHHSSNSMTARLIGRVRENLEVFIAPAAGFSYVLHPASHSNIFLIVFADYVW